MAESQTKHKVAILGGGCGAMTAAFELTAPDLRDRFDVTVYQMGWRLGGKGASGRSRRGDFGQRIEEHGLHIWAGFYDNAFEVMKACYDELKRGPEVPIRSMHDAFSPQDLVTLMQKKEGDKDDWTPHYLKFPERPGDPRDDPDALEDFSVPVVCRLLCGWLLSDFCTCVPQGNLTAAPDLTKLSLPGHMANALSHVGRYWIRPEISATGASAPEPWMQFIHLVGAASNAVANGDLPLFDDGSDAVMFLLERFSDNYIAYLEKSERETGADHTVRKIAVDLAAAAIAGFFRDRLFLRGFESIDHLELRQWLRLNGARESSLNSFVMRAAYDYTFGYIDGETGADDRVVPKSAQLAAGTGIKGILRVLLTYRGHVFWHMNAGMGDIVFAPFYQLLKQRGVRFKFFHRVDGLDVGEDEFGRAAIKSIRLGQQAKVSGGKDYDPLITVKGLPCWPSTPKWELLENGAELKKGKELKDGGFDLERIDTGWKDVGKLTLKRGEDFDHVVLGIPVGDQGRICADLVAKDDRWHSMLQALKTVPTLALQLWSSWDSERLGWDKDQPALATSFAQPFNSWADLSLLIKREDWPADRPPGSIHYFCGPLKRSYGQGTADGYVKAQALNWFRKNIKHLWPKAPPDPESVLYKVTGGNAFDDQYWRANTKPSDLYVMSVPDSTRYRLPAGESGFANLFLAGDWVLTDLNAGCVECAVMAGRDAAEALIAESRPRYWETELLHVTVRGTEGAAVLGANLAHEVIETLNDTGHAVFVTTVHGIADLVIALGDNGAAAMRGSMVGPREPSHLSIPVPGHDDRSKYKTLGHATSDSKSSPAAQLQQQHAGIVEPVYALNRLVDGVRKAVLEPATPAPRRAGQSETPAVTGAATSLAQSMSGAVDALNQAVLGSQQVGGRLQRRSTGAPAQGMVDQLSSVFVTTASSMNQALGQLSTRNRR